ncbi:XRE family transcriptional regulator [Larkinella sp. GY13]|uniref:XRE family transcriptional regulator n=1 Tax=Larkinella sp. GY13 TaxID=3453720 RepID=UPI003EEDCBF5
MYLADNLTLLRSYYGMPLMIVAGMADVTHPTLAKYEKGETVPPMDVAARLATYYKVSLDVLYFQPLRKLSQKQLEQLLATPDPLFRGRSLQVREVVHTVDQHNQELIDLVPVPAAMGYSQGGWESKAFIEKLPKFNLPLPNISPDRLYRLFPATGDSMLPIAHGSYVLGEYLQDWYSVRNGMGYIFVLQDGIVFKKAVNELSEHRRFELHSLNPVYKPYHVPVSEVREIWKFTLVMSDIFPDSEPSFDLVVSELRRLRSGQEELLKRTQ